MVISFFCCNCGRKIETANAAAGTTIVCESCGQPASVPPRPATGPSTTPGVTATRSPQKAAGSGSNVGCIIGAVVAGVVLIASFRLMDAIADGLGIPHALFNTLVYGGALVVSLAIASKAKGKK
ncbi:hypothetical protein FJY68_13990 [candidate division WOR-3 bacterium]|uniref:Uncharacterized protein n=1 Tax=candidate division WOR-3 bacterium TaxID=2052148 RepID=A0A937XJM4_UNCW3|nr:hypothetical protein [candidate division WOR-3 bacterium]